MKFNPIFSLFKTGYYFLSGKIKFPKTLLNVNYKMEDKVTFRIFRQVIVKYNDDTNTSIFKVRFKLANMSPKDNIHFSLIPIPLFVGLPGFKKKLWMINDTNGYFQGVYEWDSRKSAEMYSRSFAFKFMKRRSIPDSLFFEIIEDMTLEDYLKLIIRVP